MLTLYVWIDENGAWKCAHIPPHGEHCLMFLLQPEQRQVSVTLVTKIHA